MNVSILSPNPPTLYVGTTKVTIGYSGVTPISLTLQINGDSNVVFIDPSGNETPQISWNQGTVNQQTVTIRIKAARASSTDCSLTLIAKTSMGPVKSGTSIKYS